MLQLDDWVLCRIYKKNSSSQKAMPSFSMSKEYSNGSSPSSSTHIDDMLELPEIDDRCFALPRVNSLQHDEKLGIHNLGAGNFPDWVNQAGLDSVPEFGNQTQGMVNYGGNDLYVPSVPQFCHVDTTAVPGNPTEEEVQSGMRTQRIDENSGLFQNVFNQRLLSGSVDPFGFGYMNQQFGFGLRE